MGAGIDWSAYDTCPICLRERGRVCKGGQVHTGRTYAPVGDYTKWQDIGGSEAPGGLGPMSAAVQADLDALGAITVPGGHTYVETCKWLAGVIDRRENSQEPAVTARLAAELTKAMQLLTRRSGDDDEHADFRDFTATLSQPVSTP